MSGSSFADTIWARLQRDERDENATANSDFGTMDPTIFMADTPQDTNTSATTSSPATYITGNSSPVSTIPLVGGSSQETIFSPPPRSQQVSDSPNETSFISQKAPCFLPTQSHFPDTTFGNYFDDLPNFPVTPQEWEYYPLPDELVENVPSLPFANNGTISPQPSILENHPNIHHPKPVRSIRSSLEQIQAVSSLPHRHPHPQPPTQQPQPGQTPVSLDPSLFTLQSNESASNPTNSEPTPSFHTSGSVLAQVQFLRDNPIVSFYNYKQGLDGDSAFHDKGADRLSVAYSWLRDQYWDTWAEFISFNPHNQTSAGRQQKWEFW